MPPTPAQSGDSTALHRGILLLAAFFAVLLLLLHGASCGHDVDFHTTSWMEAAAQWRHGVLWPRWAFTPAWGAGEPRFLFYPPLSWLLGGLLALAMPVRFVPAAFTFITLALCGLTMYRLAARFAAPRCALLAAVFYMMNPYMLFCAYERCAYGELLAAAWMPLLVLAALRTPISLRGVAVPVALLWLSNAPSAVMSCYLFALLALVRLALLGRHAFIKRRLQTMLPFALRAAGGVLLGLGLAAFYILPAAWERRWVRIEMATIPPMDIASNTLYHRTIDPIHDAVLRTASNLAVLLIAITAVFLIAAWRQHMRSNRSLAAQLTVAVAVIVFALTPLSLFAWQHLPQLHYLQFPWRLLALLGVLCALLLALSVRGAAGAAPGGTLLIASVLLPAVLVPPAYSQYAQRCFDDDAPALQAVDFRAGLGVDGTDEYTPRTVGNDPLVTDLYPWWLSNDPRSFSRHPEGQNGSIEFDTTRTIRIPAAHADYLILRLRNYPAWQLRVNGAPAQLVPRSDGLFAIVLPAGEADVTLRYRTLPDEIIGVLISLVSLIVFLLLSRRARHRGMNALAMPIQPATPFMPAALPT